MRGRGVPGPPPGGPRGAAAGAAVRGSRGAMRGRSAPASGRGGRGGNTPQKMGQQFARGGKRKAQGDFSMGQTKRRNVQDNWGAQPIAQQPLDSTGYDGGYNDSQWYQDSYGQNWG